MANLATDLLRTTTRAFYQTEHILVVDALILHSTLPDIDLAHLLGMQPKQLRKLCGRLKEDGLLSVQIRQEKRTDGSASFYPSGSQGQQAKERMTNRDWYYLNYHRAIDGIKYRRHKMDKHFQDKGKPATENKEFVCPQCTSQWTRDDVMPYIDMTTGSYFCPRCRETLDEITEADKVIENESIRRLNSQLAKIEDLMRQIDATTVPENDFQSALARYKPIHRTDANPAQRTEVVDLPNRNLLSSKGLDLKPEKIDVSLSTDEDAKKAEREAEERLRREKEARQNAVPDWMAKSTVSGELTAVGAKEERLRQEREASLQGVNAALKVEEEEDKKPAGGAGADVDLAAYWAELEREQKREAAERAAEEDEDDDDEEDEFEDVDVGSSKAAASVGGVGVNGARRAPPSTGASTPALESSNATDDERDAKRPKLNGQMSSASQTNGFGTKNVAQPLAADTPAASDEDDDELEFQDV